MRTTLNPETVDLATLAQELARCVPPGARAGTLVGRTVFRDATVDLLRCSALEAELIVDTLVARGFLVLERREHPIWRIRTSDR